MWVCSQYICRLICLLYLSLISVLSFSQTIQEDKSGALPRIVRLEPGILETLALTRKECSLPPLPADLKIPTAAVLELAIDKTGAVQNVRPVSVHARLQEQATKAAKEWRFPPYLENGKPVMVLGNITMHFRPADPAPEAPEIMKARTEVEQDSANPARHITLAKLYEASGRYEDAIAELERSISLKADFEEGFLLLAGIYGRMREFDRQAEQYKNYLELKPDSTEVLDLLGRRYMELKQYEDAIEILNRLLKLRPNDASVMGEIGLAYTQQNEIEKAIRTYRKAVAITPESAILHDRLGYELVRVRQFREAESELNRALSIDPHLVSAYRHKAEVYWYTDRAEEGLDMAKTAIKNASSDLQDLDKDFFILANFCSRLKKYNDAATYHSQAIEINPENTDAYCGLGAANAQQNKNEQALEDFNRGLRVSQNSPCLHAGLGFLLTQMNRPEEAEDHLRKALKLMPENPQSYALLANLLAGKGDYTEAMSLLESAVKLAPGDYRVHLAVADVLYQSGKIKEAEQELRDSLRFEPKNPLALNNLGYFLIDQDRDVNEAVEMIEEAVAADPQNAAYLDSYGWAQFKLGKLDVAEKYLLSSLKIKPEEPIVLEHLGDVYMKQNKLDMARQRWSQAVALARKDDQLKRLRQKLGEGNQK
jgi:tetratricopeptide (TPR) repeat protein